MTGINGVMAAVLERKLLLMSMPAYNPYLPSGTKTTRRVPLPTQGQGVYEQH